MLFKTRFNNKSKIFKKNKNKTIQIQIKKIQLKTFKK